MRPKRIVVFAFTLLWCIVLVARMRHSAAGNQQLDASWVMSLASTLQQGWISGRDYHFTYGPVAQLIAWGATSVTASANAFDALPVILFAFGATSALLIAAFLLWADRVGWGDAVLIYVGCAVLNLFIEFSGMRLAMLLAASLVTYHAVTASTRASYRVAVMGGIAAVICQLVTLELAIYAVASGIGLFTFALLRSKWKPTDDLPRPDLLWKRFVVYLGTVTISNVILAALYTTTATHKIHFYDYHYYALQMVRGYNNGTAVSWQLNLASTVTLILIAAYCVVACARAIFSAPVPQSSFLLSLLLPSLLVLKSSLVRSDLGHITYAFAPIVFLFLVLGKTCLTRHTRVMGTLWCALLLMLIRAWPWAGLSAAMDIWLVVRGDVSLREISRDALSAKTDASTVLSPSMAAALSEPNTRPVLNFPYENYVSVLMRRPLMAPILQTHNAGTDALQYFYVNTLQQNLSSGFDVVFGSEALPLDGIQNVTRVPRIFEFLYNNFVLQDGVGEGGFYLLRRRPTPRIATHVPLQVTANNRGASGEMILPEPSNCGLPGFELEMSFSPAMYITKPGDLAVTFWLNNEEVATRHIKPIETNRPFGTFVSLIDDFEFYRVFGNDRVASHRWNRITYAPVVHDRITIPPHHVALHSLTCMDPERWYTDGHLRPEPMFQFEADTATLTGDVQVRHLQIIYDQTDPPYVTERITRFRDTPAFVEIPEPSLADRATVTFNAPSSEQLGLAISNPNDHANRIELMLNGSPSRTRTLTLPPNGQVAQMMEELIGHYHGPEESHLFIRGDLPFAAIGVDIGFKRIINVPLHLEGIVKEKRPVSIPQFASGAGWATEIIIHNPTNAVMTGRVQVFSTAGTAAPAVLNGIEATAFEYRIETGESTTFSSRRLASLERARN